MFAVRSFNEVPFHRGPFPHILLLMGQKLYSLPRIYQGCCKNVEWGARNKHRERGNNGKMKNEKKTENWK